MTERLARGSHRVVAGAHLLPEALDNEQTVIDAQTKPNHCHDVLQEDRQRPDLTGKRGHA